MKTFNEAESKKSVLDTVENIWRRARHNAFAHKIACENAKQMATKMFIIELTSSLLSILLIIFTYIVLSSTPEFIISTNINKEIVSIISTIGSIVFSLGAIFVGVMSNNLKYDVKEAEHSSALGSYQRIAQKARMVRWPDMPYSEMVVLMKNLEEEFQLLKARGREPSDDDFEQALVLFKKIIKDSESQKAQSFKTDDDGENPI